MFGIWIFQIITLLLLLTMFALILGEYMAKVFSNKRTILSPIITPIENSLYKLFGINPTEEMSWKTFAYSFLLLTLIGIISLFIIQKTQGWLLLNPENFKNLSWDSALNTAISFATNTNWQAYKSENTLSYLTNMLGMGVQNFLSAAAGMAVAIALINSFVRKNCHTLGNFWVYLTRSILYILLPLSLILALFLISQGAVDNFNSYTHATTLENRKQIIAQGPAASQVAIKNLGSNGGGFFAANSAHPYENPTPFTDYITILSLLIIAAAFPFTFGALMNDRSKGWTIFIAMMLLFTIGLGMVVWSELRGNPLFTKLNILNGANLEGKELRFGITSSATFANAATASGAGATNASLDSFMPISGLTLIFNIAIGEVIFGGVGSGFIGMMFYIMLTMFLIALSIGKSPEIYGKKLGAYEMLMTVLVLFLPCILRFILSALATSTSSGITELGNPGFHGLSEILYTFASTIGNNGSAFSGIEADTIFYNLATGFAMLFGRLITIIPALAIAGSIASKNRIPSVARFTTTTPIFVLVLISVILIIGALAFLPTLVLGPIIEHLYVFIGKTF